MALENYQQKINCKLCVVHTVSFIKRSYVIRMYELYMKFILGFV